MLVILENIIKEMESQLPWPLVSKTLNLKQLSFLNVLDLAILLK